MKRLDTFENFSQAVSDIIMAENFKEVEYDSWYSTSPTYRLDNINFSEVFFRFEYSHDNHGEIEALEKKILERLEKNKKDLTILLQTEIEGNN